MSITKHNALILMGIVAVSGCANDYQGGADTPTETAPVQPTQTTRSESDIQAADVASLPAPTLHTRALKQMPAHSYQTFEGTSMPAWHQQQDRENYLSYKDNRVRQVSRDPVSTFSVDVDTESYANVRRILRDGQLPDKHAVRSEEFVNYFSYDYPAPQSSAVPFSVNTEIAPSPWNENSHLLHIGLQGYEVDKADIPAANLVFLLDVSGSMNDADKLPLVKKSLELLTRHLRPQDRISIVVYAGAAGMVLEPTSGKDSGKILHALGQLSAGGSTNGQAGIEQAYQLAREHFVDGGVNRIIICTDGDFNVGSSSIDALKQRIEKERQSGITLTTLGFGRGNYNSALMEQLADVGNGNAAYIDTLLEANKVLVSEMSSTLFTIASDVKIQLEFSPQVASYRLVGYENRMLNREDFNNDKVDAGDIGAGHSVTAVYEITLADAKSGLLDPLRYQKEHRAQSAHRDEIAYLKLRYKLPGERDSQLVSQPIYRSQIVDKLENASSRLRWSASVAGFSQVLRASTDIGDFGYSDILQLARASKQSDPHGYRGEFIQLVSLAQSLQGTYAKNESQSTVN